MVKTLFLHKISPSENSFFPKNHKGLSGVITAVIMIALVMAAAGIVWGVVNNVLKGQMESSEACFGNYNKVTINSIYTCYNSELDTFQFSLNIGDIEVDEVLVSVSSEGATNSYTLTNDAQTITGLFPYVTQGFDCDEEILFCEGEEVCINGNCVLPGEVMLPAKNAGLTYIASGFSVKPDLIRIAPIISGQQCEVSDTVSNIEACFL